MPTLSRHLAAISARYGATMRQQLTRTVVIALALGAAVMLVVAGAAYFVEYQEWNAAGTSFVYRQRPFSSAVFAASACAGIVVVALGGLVATHIDPAGRLRPRRR